LPPQPFLAPARRLQDCAVCITARLRPPVNDVRPYRYDNATCLYIQASISASINAIIAAAGASMLSAFAPNPANCFDLSVSVCGTFVSDADASKLKAAAEAQLPLWLAAAVGEARGGSGGGGGVAIGGVVGGVCRPELERYRVEVTTEGEACLPLNISTACFLPFNPFPNCT
jgi:hypothetical protein